jgi:hypothetical protein
MTCLFLGSVLLFQVMSVKSALAADTEPSPVPAPSALPSHSYEPKQLLKEFVRAQASELKAIEHRQKLELAEMKSSHAARLKYWNQSEENDRHQFFKDHTRGEERREYIQGFKRRREDLLKLIVDERTKHVSDQLAELKKLKEDQAAKLKSLKDQIAKGEKPDESLWPKGT